MKEFLDSMTGKLLVAAAVVLAVWSVPGVPAEARLALTALALGLPGHKAVTDYAINRDAPSPRQEAAAPPAAPAKPAGKRVSAFLPFIPMIGLLVASTGCVSSVSCSTLERWEGYGRWAHVAATAAERGAEVACRVTSSPYCAALPGAVAILEGALSVVDGALEDMRRHGCDSEEGKAAAAKIRAAGALVVEQAAEIGQEIRPAVPPVAE